MKRQRLIILITAIIIYFILVAVVWDYSIDDAFVTFRYAEHLADGHGLVFNIGEKPVEGYSNFLWLLILALVYKLGLATYLTAKILGIALFLVSALIWFFLFCRTEGYLWLIGPLLLITPYTSFWAVSGLELGLHAMLLAGAVFSLFRKSLWSIPFTSALVMTRSEGAVIGLILIMVRWLTDREGKKAATKLYIINLIFLVITFGALAIFRLSVFGYPMPNTFYAKSSFSIISLIELGRPLLYFLPLTVLFLYGLIPLIRKSGETSEAATAIFVWLGMAVISCLASPVMNFNSRYMIAFLPFFLMVALMSLEHFSRPNVIRAFLMVSVISLLIPISAVLQTVSQEREIMAAQSNLIDYLKRQPDEIMVSLTDVGRVPYYTVAKYNDIWGLVSEDVAHRGFNALREYLRFPDYFILVGYMGNDGPRLRFGRERLITRNRGFKQAYRLTGAGLPSDARLETPGYYYLIFKKEERAVDSLLELYPINPVKEVIR
nr:hypothetical protein [candidate division Zixibacteria bacterium]